MANWVTLTGRNGGTVRLNLDQAIMINAAHANYAPAKTEIVFDREFFRDPLVQEEVEVVWAMARHGGSSPHA